MSAIEVTFRLANTRLDITTDAGLTSLSVTLNQLKHDTEQPCNCGGDINLNDNQFKTKGC